MIFAFLQPAVRALFTLLSDSFALSAGPRRTVENMRVGVNVVNFRPSREAITA